MSKNIFGGLKSLKTVFNSSDLEKYLIFIDDTMRETIQQDLLDMYIDILEVCRKYDILPYLVGGSALGAIRHQGFIPWDDDLDIGMFRKDYIIFKKVFEKELSNKYILNAPNYSEHAKARFPKIIKKGTVFSEIFDRENDTTGLFLDIFIIDNIPNNPIKRKIKGTFCNLMEFIAGQVLIEECDNEIVTNVIKSQNGISYLLRKVVGKLFSYHTASEWYNKIDKIIQCENETSEMCGMVTGRKHYFGEIMPRVIFKNVRWVDFETIKAPVFGEIEKYLEKMYGDYMKIPPENQREHHFIRKIQL